jgi:nucleotidyltransferase substrate binding protein (TIGR01987 family)
MVSTSELEKAIASLTEALNQEPTDKLVRDGTIQRFEYTFELAWKVAKKKMGTTSVAPKVVIREMAQQGLISDADKWLSYADARNESSHAYKEDTAVKVYAFAKEFAKDCIILVDKLKKL